MIFIDLEKVHNRVPKHVNVSEDMYKRVRI